MLGRRNPTAPPPIILDLQWYSIGMTDASKKASSPDQNAFTVTFKNGALAQLQDAATSLGIQNNAEGFGEVLMKGLKLIQIAKKNKVIIDSKEERIQIDLEHL